MQKYKLMLLFLLSIVSIFGQNKVIELEIDGKLYDNLRIHVHHLYQDESIVEGQCASGKKWVFNIPDSIAKETLAFEFRHTQKDDSIEVDRILCFYDVINGDTTAKVMNMNFDMDIDTLRLLFSFDESLADSDDCFMVNSSASQALHERLSNPTFGFFYDWKDVPERKYEDFMSEYVSLIEKNPNSIYYLNTIASTQKAYYKSQDDVKRLYNLFSPAMKESYFGKDIYHYIEGLSIKSEFTNIALPLWNEDRDEPIIEDTSKYNLIIFSASWCVPCRAEIPVLKEIHNDLKQNLIMTYISVDELSTVGLWKDLMQKEDIPWRSLLAVDEMKKIKKAYSVREIPYIILVYPGNSRFKFIDVRKKEDRDMLYLLCGDNIK